MAQEYENQQACPLLSNIKINQYLGSMQVGMLSMVLEWRQSELELNTWIELILFIVNNTFKYQANLQVVKINLLF